MGTHLTSLARRMFLSAAILALVLVSVVPLAASGGGTISSVIFRVDASDGVKSGYVEYEAVYGGSGILVWNLAGPTEIVSQDLTVLGVLTTGTTLLNPDPRVALGFSLTNPTAGAVDYVVSSAVVGFAALTNPGARASAGLTLTTDGSAGTITGAFQADAKSYRAFSNVGDFAYLVDNLSALADATDTDSEAFGDTSTTPIFGSVSSIASQFSFALTPGDQASGTSTFVIVPEPASLAALGMGLASLAGLRGATRARRRA